MPTRVAPDGGLRTKSLNEVLRRQLGDALAHAVAALWSEPSVGAELVDGDADDVLARLARVGPAGARLAGYGPIRGVLLGSVSSVLVRAAASPSDPPAWRGR